MGQVCRRRFAEFVRFGAIDESSPSQIFHLSIQRKSHGYKKSTIVLVSEVLKMFGCDSALAKLGSARLFIRASFEYTWKQFPYTGWMWVDVEA